MHNESSSNLLYRNRMDQITLNEKTIKTHCANDIYIEKYLSLNQ